MKGYQYRCPNCMGIVIGFCGFLKGGGFLIYCSFCDDVFQVDDKEPVSLTDEEKERSIRKRCRLDLVRFSEFSRQRRKNLLFL